MVYLSFGGIPMDYAVLTFLVGLTFTIIGQVCSLLTLCNAPFVLVSCVWAVKMREAAEYDAALLLLNARCPPVHAT